MFQNKATLLRFAPRSRYGRLLQRENLRPLIAGLKKAQFDDRGDWTQWTEQKLKTVLRQAQDLYLGPLQDSNYGYTLVERASRHNVSWTDLRDYQKADILALPVSDGFREEDLDFINQSRKEVSNFLRVYAGGVSLPPIKFSTGPHGEVVLSNGSQRLELETIRDLYKLNDWFLAPEEVDQVEEIKETLEKELRSR